MGRKKVPFVYGMWMPFDKICGIIAEKTGLARYRVKLAIAELKAIAYKELAKTEKFVIFPRFVTLKLKRKAATKAGKKMVFGQLMKVKAKPAEKVVKAYASKRFQDDVLEWGLVLDEELRKEFGVLRLSG
jgi:hypothetical protein